MILPPWLAAMAGWSLLLAYVATGAASLGGFYLYGNMILRDATGHTVSAVLLVTSLTGVSMWITWRDVKISARLMLWIEAVSITLISIVVILVLARHGLHGDVEQIQLRGMTGSGLRLGLVLALFSFVGFESATTLGTEARNPLKTIPRAVFLSSLLGGIFFTLSAYTEVLGFRIVGQNLGTSDAPFRVLARVGGLPVLGTLIDVGALVSMFAGMLACVTAAARVLLLMAHNGLTHGSLRNTHARNETPGVAILVSGLASFIPVRDSGISRHERPGRLRLDGLAGDVRIYCRVRVGLPRAPALSPRPPRSCQRGDKNNPTACVHCDGAGFRRKPISCP